MTDTKKVGGMPIAFPAGMHHSHDARWFIDGSGSFVVDARTTVAQWMASHMKSPGMYVPRSGKPGLERSGDMSEYMSESVEQFITAAHARTGVECSVLGDRDSILFDPEPGQDTPSPQQMLDAEVVPWELVDQAGSVVGTVDGHKLSALTIREQLVFRYDTVGDTEILFGYWRRNDQPALILPAVRANEPAPEPGEVDWDAPIGDSGLTHREAIGVTADLLSAWLAKDIDELGRVFQRGAMLDPDGSAGLPLMVVFGLCEAISHSLPPQMKDHALELEVEDDAPADSATRAAVGLFVAYHNGDRDEAARMFREAAVSDEEERDVALIVELLNLFDQFNAMGREGATDDR